MRTRIQNALQSIALANGLRRGTALWSQDGQNRIAALPLTPHTAYRRSELQAMYEKFEAEIEKLNQRVEEQAGQRSGARLLMTHPGVGPITALATEVFLGDPARFADSKALASYVGMIPREYSSGGRQRLGGLSKQGNPLLRFLWGEAGKLAIEKAEAAGDKEWSGRLYLLVENKLANCECGGRFKYDAPRRCLRCFSVLTQSEPGRDVWPPESPDEKLSPDYQSLSSPMESLIKTENIWLT